MNHPRSAFLIYTLLEFENSSISDGLKLYIFPIS